MNKYKELLVKNSQWVAVGIGGLWLLYMIYSHVLASTMSSVEVKGAPNQLGPASVDEYVKLNTIDKLKEAMVKNEPWKPHVIDFPVTIRDTIALKDDTAETIPGRPLNAVFVANTPVGPDITKVIPNTVSGLVVVPPATGVSGVTGKSVVTVPAPPNAANGQATQQRQLWVSVFGTVPMKELEKAFKDAGVNKLNVAAAQQTVFLHVDIRREELLPNGNFGNPVEMISIPVNLANPGNTQPLFPPLPPNQAGPQLNFRNQAAGQQQLICQPEFFVVTKGDPWHKPGENPGQVGAVVAPPPPPPAPPKNTGRQPPRKTGTPREPGIREPSILAPAEKTGDRLPFMQVFNEPQPNGMPGYPSPGGQPGGSAVPNQAANALGAVPVAPFSPLGLNDVTLWAHDLTVMPGKTYQYKIRYSISNPIFQFKNLCPPGKVAWAAQFELTSEWSVATPPVTVPDTTNVFLANAIPNKGEAIFDIFVWGIGGVVKSTVRCTPGDMIDENLKLSLLDVRSTPSGAIVLLVDGNGTIYRRSQREDDSNAAYKQLKQEAANPPALTP